MQPGSVRDVQVTVLDKDQVSISWKPPKTGGKVKGYKIRCGDLESEVADDVSWDLTKLLHFILLLKLLHKAY